VAEAENGTRSTGSGEPYFDTINPANAQKLSRIAKANDADLDAAVKAARKACHTVWTDEGSMRLRPGSSGIFSFTSKLRTGVIWANTYNTFDPTSPFGGYMESGYGRKGGVHGLGACFQLNLSADGADVIDARSTGTCQAERS
jgi:acyl-CoA reductase-like NAD-dependent aldehyde dehydrogenase